MRKLFGLILGLILMGFCAASTFAQNNPAQNNPQNKPKASKTRTITGCLSKGDNPDEYKLTAKNGSTFELRSGGTSAMSSNEKSSVNLAEHVGHTVTVTGTVERPEMHDMGGMKEEKQGGKEGKEESGMKKHEHGNKPLEFNVISIKHVSPTCT